MKRRTYLASIGMGLLAGCTGDGDDSSTDTTTTTRTTTETTPTETETLQQKPEIKEANLVSRWEQFGDVEDYEMESAGAGGDIGIGFRYSAMTHDGVSNTKEQVRVFDDQQNRVAMKSDESNQLTEGSGVEVWEHTLWFDTSNWDKGEYSAEILIQDKEAGLVSEPLGTDFRLITPLTKEEAELVNVQMPDTVTVGESVSFELEIKNTSNRDNSMVSHLSGKYETADEWEKSDYKISLPIRAGETNTWESTETSFPYEGTYEMKLDAIGEMWSVTVTE